MMLSYNIFQLIDVKKIKMGSKKS